MKSNHSEFFNKKQYRDYQQVGNGVGYKIFYSSYLELVSQNPFYSLSRGQHFTNEMYVKYFGFEYSSPNALQRAPRELTHSHVSRRGLNAYTVNLRGLKQEDLVFILNLLKDCFNLSEDDKGKIINAYNECNEIKVIDESANIGDDWNLEYGAANSYLLATNKKCHVYTDGIKLVVSPPNGSSSLYEMDPQLYLKLAKLFYSHDPSIKNVKTIEIDGLHFIVAPTDRNLAVLGELNPEKNNGLRVNLNKIDSDLCDQLFKFLSDANVLPTEVENYLNGNGPSRPKMR